MENVAIQIHEVQTFPRHLWQEIFNGIVFNFRLRHFLIYNSIKKKNIESQTRKASPLNHKNYCQEAIKSSFSKFIGILGTFSAAGIF